MNEYEQRLENCKTNYPFEQWRALYNDGFDQYTDMNCDKAKGVFDVLIGGLKSIGEHASHQDKIALFEKAVLGLNKLNEEEEDLIETGEREDLCGLFDLITVAAGLDPKNFGDGEGIADEWREW